MPCSPNQEKRNSGKFPACFAIEDKIPLGLIFTLLVQAAMIVWWASSRDALDKIRDTQISELHQYVDGDQKYLLEISQRLARIEAHMDDHSMLLHQLLAQKNKK